MINVKHVAKLADLTLSDKELPKFEKQLSEVLDHVEKLQGIKTDKVPETSQVTGLENVTRDDGVNLERTLTQDEALSQTSLKENGLFKVKGVIQNE